MQNIEIFVETHGMKEDSMEATIGTTVALLLR